MHVTTSVGRLVSVLALVFAGCAGGEMTMSEYVERVDAIFERGIERYEAVVEGPQGLVLIAGQGPHMDLEDRGTRLSDFTPYDLHLALLEVAAIQAEALEAAAAIEPPPQIADLHALYFRELPIAELAARAATAADWEELSDSPGMTAYRKALAADAEACTEFQATLDATADRGVFAENTWLPERLTEIVDYALSCGSLPQNPEDAYRPPPPGSSAGS